MRLADPIATAVIVALAAPAAAGLAPASPAAARTSANRRPVLRWTAPRQIDRGHTKIGLARVVPASSRLHGGIPITGVSCPAASLCVVVDLNGNALVSRAPARPGSWRRFLVDPMAPLNGVSCPSPHFCAAVDTMGGVVTSSHPLGGRTAWRRVIIRKPIAFAGGPVPVPLTSIGCASAHLCVSGDDYPGEIMTSTRPRGGSAAWRSHVGLGRRHGGLISASCPTTTFCAAVTDEGVSATTAPLSGRSTATVVNASLESISCGSRTLCVAVVGGQQQGGSGGVWRSTDPAAPTPHWTPALSDDDEQFAVACHGPSLCVATDSAGRVMMSARPRAAEPRWQTRRVDGRRVLSGISCPTAGLCVAGDTYGYLVVGRRSGTADTIGTIAASRRTTPGGPPP